MLFTGYLKEVYIELYDSNEIIATMAIPNREIMEAYLRTISVCFNEKSKKEGASELIQVFPDEKPDGFQKSMNLWFRKKYQLS